MLEARIVRAAAHSSTLLSIGIVCIVVSLGREQAGLEPEDKLHEDHAVEQLVDYNIGDATKCASRFFDIPCLSVVPLGESQQRQTVFEALELEDSRTIDFQYTYRHKVIFLTWRISPSYFVTLMTGCDGIDTSSDELMVRFSQCRPELHSDIAHILVDSKREVFGVRLHTSVERF
ncbi:MAG: hypothetical protein AAGG48_31100 [Planctomycetota bacterium]